jgi:hypothetical protein
MSPTDHAEATTQLSLLPEKVAETPLCFPKPVLHSVGENLKESSSGLGTTDLPLNSSSSTATTDVGMESPLPPSVAPSVAPTLTWADSLAATVNAAFNSSPTSTPTSGLGTVNPADILLDHELHPQLSVSNDAIDLDVGMDVDKESDLSSIKSSSSSESGMNVCLCLHPSTHIFDFCWVYR